MHQSARVRSIFGGLAITACLLIPASCAKPKGIASDIQETETAATETSSSAVTAAAAKRNDGQECDTKNDCKSGRCIINDAGETGFCGCGKPSKDPEMYGQPCCPRTTADFQQSPPNGKCTNSICKQTGLGGDFDNRCECGELDQPCCSGGSMKCAEDAECKNGKCVNCGQKGDPCCLHDPNIPTGCNEGKCNSKKICK